MRANKTASIINDNPKFSNCKINKNELLKWLVNQLPKEEINAEIRSETISKKAIETIRPNENNLILIISQMPDFFGSSFTSQMIFNAF
jgi:hypothetical protein